MDALTMGSLLKEPKNLLELIDFGIKNEGNYTLYNS
jgi:hypothetical protein